MEFPNKKGMCVKRRVSEMGCSFCVSSIFSVKLWNKVVWKWMEIHFKLWHRIVSSRDIRYCNNMSGVPYQLHGQVVSQLQKGPLCCQILTITCMTKQFENKQTKKTPQYKQKTNKKTPNPQNLSTPSLPKKPLQVHTSHVILLKSETATRN